MSFKLRTLGGLSLDSSTGPIPGRVTQRKRLALLALLAAQRNGGLTRDKVIAYLWPERDEDHGRHALSQVLYALKRDLSADVVLAGVDELRLNGDVISSDVAELNRAITSRDARGIAELYAGPFLDGVFLNDAPEFEEWAAEQRAVYEREYMTALDQLANAAIDGGRANEAVELLHRRAAVDRLNSDVALRLMRALAMTGDRAAALRHYRMHSTLLREELDLEPDADLAAFAEFCAQKPEAADHVRVNGISEERPPLLLPPPSRTRRRPRLRYFTPALLIPLAIVPWASRHRSSSLPSSYVVLADVSGPDSSLNLAVREAFRAELEKNSDVRVLSDAAAARTLELMKLHPASPLTDHRATEIALRRGIPFVMTASVHPVGTGVQIVARIQDAQTEQVIGSAMRRPANDTQLLDAIGSIAGEMRKKLDRSGQVARSPLPAVTTSSLDALRDYALARQALATLSRPRALEFVEAALVHDSSFALAHYLAADLLWYLDQQRHSDEHIQHAMAMLDRLPPRERLIVQARYQQLVRDEPDSALVYWKLLADSYPDEALAFEGMRWVYRALARTREMAGASRRGYELDPGLRVSYLSDRIEYALARRDSADLFAATREILPTLPGVLPRIRYLWAISNGRTPSAGLGDSVSGLDAQYVNLLHHRWNKAAQHMIELREAPLQYFPRALLAQARMEAELNPGSERANALLYAVSGWIENADISPPAYARLCERAAEAAVRLNDRPALERLRIIIDKHDQGRNLRSYAYARLTIDAAAAYLAGDYVRAAALAERAQGAVFYARSVATVALLHADAVARAYGFDRARPLYNRIIATDQIRDGDLETHALIRHLAQYRLARQANAGT